MIWPDRTRPAIIAPGPHRSYLDGPLLAVTTPRPMLFAVTPEFALHPVWRPLLLGVGYIRGCSMIPMRPGSAYGVRSLLNHLAAGGWVCVFPGGGIDTGLDHPGVDWLSRKSGVQIHRVGLKHGIGFGPVRYVRAA